MSFSLKSKRIMVTVKCQEILRECCRRSLIEINAFKKLETRLALHCEVVKLIEWRHLATPTLIILFISSASLFCSCKGKTPTEPLLGGASWAGDINYLDSQFKADEYGFSSLISPQRFDSTLNYISASADSLQDYQVYINIQKLIASLNVAHINVIPPMQWQFHYLPIYTRIFSDGVYIVMTDQQDAGLLGKKIISIGGVPMQTVEDSLAKMISHENVYWLDRQLPAAISCVELLKNFGFTSSLSDVEINLDGLGDVTLSSSECSFNSFTIGLTRSVLDGKSLPLYMQNGSSNYWYTYLQAERILYIKYNSCIEESDKSFADFTNEIIASIDSNQVDKVVVDIRNNGGGNSDIIDPLLNYLQNSPFNRIGKLFVVTDWGTFSSASMDAIWFKQGTNCILVGEPTGGKPNSYGNILSFTLPNSQIKVYYCTKYFQQMAGDPASLFPDYDIETTAQQYMDCDDTVMDFIINYQ